MNWYTVYFDQDRVGCAADLLTAKKLAPTYFRPERPMTIEKAESRSGLVLDVWHYDYDADEWIADERFN